MWMLIFDYCLWIRVEQGDGQVEEAIEETARQFSSTPADQPGE